MYDVVIIGAGPAGIFTAIELTKLGDFDVLLVEKGKGIEERERLARGSESVLGQPWSSLVSGWGGAGAFCDGKLNLSPDIGGSLGSYIGRDKLVELLNYVDGIYLDFGAPNEVYGADQAEMEALRTKAAKADLKFIPSRIRHLGTERCVPILRRMRDYLVDKVDMKIGVGANGLLVEGDRVTGVELADGERIEAKYVVVAPGREGVDWLKAEADRLRLETTQNPVDVGVRVEVPAAILESLTSVAYEAKLVYFAKTFDDQVRTFCMNPHGVVAAELYDDVILVNGHSYANRKTDYTNFALLVSKTFTHPFKEPIAYGKYLARLANLLSQGIIVQRLGDLQMGRRSTSERIARGTVEPTLKEATPGDLSLVLPYRFLRDIMEMLEALDEVTPGVRSAHTLLYGVEAKFYSFRPKLSPCLETKVENLFSIGDGAGVTRGLLQASASGVVVARELWRRG